MPQTSAAAGHWILDAETSAVRFQARAMWGLAKVKGTFGTVSGEGDVAEDGTASGTLTVAAASLDTRNAKRDTHLRSADFFDTDTHASIVFSTEGVTAPGEGAGEVRITGELTVHGTSRPLAFPAKVSLPSPEEAVIEAEVSIDRADFGMTWDRLGALGGPSAVSVRAHFRRQG